MSKDLRHVVLDMIRSDLMRACRQVKGQRPGEPIPDGQECEVLVPVSNDCWATVYGSAPPTLQFVIVRARFRYHLGKRAWELQWWEGCRRLWTYKDATYEMPPADELIGEPDALSWQDTAVTDKVYVQWGGAYQTLGEESGSTIDTP